MLEKLKLTGFKDKLYNDLADTEPNPIEVLINPDGYKRGMGLIYTDDPAAGASGKARAYNRDLGESLQLTMIFDGTGTVPEMNADPSAPFKTVDEQVDELRRIAYSVNGDIHKPNYVEIAWGTLLFKGQLTKLGIDYRIFTPEGVPLRATITTEFIGYHENLDSRTAQNRRSPDLTHAIVVKAGDALPLLCHRIYGDSRYYLAVAAHNGLDDFRALAPGTMLLFPPLAGAAS